MRGTSKKDILIILLLLNCDVCCISEATSYILDSDALYTYTYIIYIIYMYIYIDDAQNGGGGGGGGGGGDP
jgi:hypothetical protein